MMIPIRCFSCGRVVASDFEKYRERVAAGESPREVLNDLGVERYCCRRMIITQPDTIDDVIPYS